MKFNVGRAYRCDGGRARGGRRGSGHWFGRLRDDGRGRRDEGRGDRVLRVILRIGVGHTRPVRAEWRATEGRRRADCTEHGTGVLGGNE